VPAKNREVILLPKRLLLKVILVSLVIIAFSPKAENWNSDDVQAIRQTALNYIEGWYEGNSDRMAAALHPNMIKRRVQNLKSGSLIEVDFETMVYYTKSGGGKLIPKDNYEIKIEILDIDNNIASVKTESQYIDYLHLAKIDNRWVILNVLWDVKQ